MKNRREKGDEPVKIWPDLVNKVTAEAAAAIQAAGQQKVVVNIAYEQMMKVRVWASTYLVCRQTGARARLLERHNLATYPNWSVLLPGIPFSLVFEGLPGGCESFDLFEDIPESGELCIPGIARNKTDVYNFMLTL